MPPNQINLAPLPSGGTPDAHFHFLPDRLGRGLFVLALWVGLSAAGCVDQQKEVGVYRSVLDGSPPTASRRKRTTPSRR